MAWCASFGAEFWEEYWRLVPRAAGWEERRQLYSLYHYLNHLNLFGGGYYGQCEQALSRLTRGL
jgi:fructosamine-3-kinase